jgi:hypothetical protein
MEKKQGFFSALKEEIVGGFSPSRSRSNSPARTASSMSGLLYRKKHRKDTSSYAAQPEPLIGKSRSSRPMVGETLSPLIEGPDPDGGVGEHKRAGSGPGLGQWMKGQLSRTPSVTSLAYKRSDLRLLLGVMGAPLAPVHVSTLDPLPHLSIKDTPIVNSLPLPLFFFIVNNVKRVFVVCVCVCFVRFFFFFWEGGGNQNKGGIFFQFINYEHCLFCGEG